VSNSIYKIHLFPLSIEYIILLQENRSEFAVEFFKFFADIGSGIIYNLVIIMILAKGNVK